MTLQVTSERIVQFKEAADKKLYLVVDMLADLFGSEPQKDFYKFKLLRSLEEIKVDILALEAQTEGVLKTIILDQ